MAQRPQTCVIYLSVWLFVFQQLSKAGEIMNFIVDSRRTVRPGEFTFLFHYEGFIYIRGLRHGDLRY